MLFGRNHSEKLYHRILTKKHALEQHVRNSSSQSSDLLTATCKTMSYPQTKRHGRRDIQSKPVTHDLESMDIISKGHDVNFNNEAKSEYVCDEINRADTNREYCWSNSLPQKAEAFYEKE